MAAAAAAADDPLLVPSWYDNYGRKGSWSSLDGSTVAFLARNFNVSPCFLVPCDMPCAHSGVPLKLPPVELQAASAVEGQKVIKLSDQALEELLDRAAAGYVSEAELALLARWVDSLEVKGAEPPCSTCVLACALEFTVAVGAKQTAASSAKGLTALHLYHDDATEAAEALSAAAPSAGARTAAAKRRPALANRTNCITQLAAGLHIAASRKEKQELAREDLDILLSSQLAAAEQGMAMMAQWRSTRTPALQPQKPVPSTRATSRTARAPASKFHAAELFIFPVLSAQVPLQP